MKLLLDTHIVLWWLGAPEKLDEEARTAIGDGSNLVYLSAAVVWEIRIKEALKKLTVPKNLHAILADQGFEELPIRVAHAHRLRRLPSVHQDPFDRILVAQALHEDATLVTRDAIFGDYPIVTLHG